MAVDADGSSRLHQYVKLEFGASGTQTPVTDAAPLPVDGSGVTQPVSASSLPLPSGAATSANQTTVIGHLDGVEGLLTTIDADTGNIAALSKAVDAVAGGSDTGIAALAVRDDSLTTLTPADGDYVPLRVNSTGALHVTGGGGGTEYSEDAATPATITGTATVMERDDALSTLTPIEGDWAAMRCNSTGALWTAVTGEVDVTPASPSAAAYLPVRITDGSAFVAPGTEYTEGDTDATITGVPMLMEGAGDALVVAQGTAADGLLVNLGGNNDVTVTGAALTALQLIDNPVVVDDAAFTPATTSVMMAGFEADEASTDSVDEGDAGAARMTLDRKLIVSPQPHTSGGLSIFRSLDLDESEEDVKTSAGQVYGWFISNLATSTRFVKFYNATAANVTVGTTTPVLTLPIPGNSTDDVSANALGGMGIAFDTAICVAATTGVADNDTGAPGANEVIVNIFYK